MLQCELLLVFVATLPDCDTFPSRIVGIAVRKVIRDGWPISQTIATDVEAGAPLDLHRPNRQH